MPPAKEPAQAEDDAPTRRPYPARLSSLVGLLRTNLWLQAAVAFFVVLALKWPVLYDPPVWDTAMSVFPAAITLVEYGFDLPRLLKEPTFFHAGPNVHSTSLITLVTAGVIGLTRNTAVFLPTLHLLHFLIAAFALVATYRYAKPVLGETISLFTVLALLTFPLFSTQAGYLYLEMPLAFTAVMAFLAWRNGKTYQSALWAVLSCWIKLTGIFVGFALAGAAIMGPGRITDRLRQATIVGLPPLVLTFLQIWAVSGALSLDPGAATPHGLKCFFVAGMNYLRGIPDLALFFVVFLIGCTFAYGRIWRGLSQGVTEDPDSMRNQFIALNLLAVLSVFVLLYVVAPLTHGYCYGLPRYYVPLLPFLVTNLSAFLTLLTTRKIAAVMIFLAIGFFVINRNGILYPKDVDQFGRFGNNFSLTERSGAYRKLALLQRETMNLLQQIPHDVPIYFGIYEDYLNRYPAMGYVKGTMPNALNVMTWDVSRMRQLLADPPECMYFVYDYPWLGGRRIQMLVSKLKATHRSETVRVFRSGDYKILLHRMRLPDSRCSAGPN